MQEAGVERVIDVRALPLSRRPGFSKSPLRAALAEAGIDYVHLKALGTPSDGRTAARAGRQEDLERIYAGQLELPEAIVQAEQMRELAAEKPSALLCYERDPAALPPQPIARRGRPRRHRHPSVPLKRGGGLGLRLADQQRLDVGDRPAGHFLGNFAHQPALGLLVQLLADHARASWAGR